MEIIWKILEVPKMEIYFINLMVGKINNKR
jgi:hypothetical protein